MENEIYLNAVLEKAPRLISLLDRNPLSKTYGCFDRLYWHYTASDFPCVRNQEAALTLALLYKINNGKNVYYKNKNIIEWVNASLEFWTKIQNKNGSFSEWYPNEHSFVATAFSVYAVSETVLLLGNEIKNRDKIIDALKKAGNWLLKKHEKTVLNQEAGAAIALLNIYLLTKEQKYKGFADEKIDFLFKNQTSEGWWNEYGGFDIGYLSLTIDYLAKYYEKTKDSRLINILNKSIDFLSYFIHPNSTYGGAYGSRNTCYLIPSGFEILSGMNTKANRIAEAVKNSLEDKKANIFSSLDDRYLSYIAYNWLQAYLFNKEGENKGKEKEGIKLPYETSFSKKFDKAGIAILSTHSIYLIINCKKGGCFSVFFKKNNKAVYDSGILLKTKYEKMISGYLSDNSIIDISKNKITVSGYLSKISDEKLSVLKNVALRTFQSTFGKSETISLMLKNKLRKKLIGKNNNNVQFMREIEFSENKITVKDTVKNINNAEEIIVGGNFSDIYTPSSRYFLESEAKNTPLIIENPEIKDKSISIKREIKEDN